MSSFDYHVVDVFTDRAFAGNPLAVLPAADGLSDEQMQAIAREFNLSETTFVLPPTQPGATYRTRIFTPSSELPFAGHPTVGTAWLLSRLGRFGAGSVVQECGAGLVAVEVSDDGAQVTGAPPTMSEELDAKPFAAALGLGAASLANETVRVCGCGLEWAYLHVPDAALGQVAVNPSALAALPGTGIYVFSYAEGRAHARSFADGVGVAEDPATGSAALGLGVYLVARGLLAAEGSSSYDIEQGIEMGRPSLLRGTVTARAGRAREVKVAGGVAEVASGRISAP
jgi:trans-2,3-dihydro-3-hydroxyanthranilate isomerase